MRKFHCIAAVLLALAAPAEAAQKAHAVAHLKNLDGKPVGTVDFAAVNRGVLVTFDLHDLPPGAHAIHLHTSGNCDAKSGFTAAGPILTLIPGKQHGYLAEGGPEAGDLPNQFAGADGHLHASVLANGFGLGNGKRSIFDRAGSPSSSMPGPTITAPSPWAMPGTASPVAWSCAPPIPRRGARSPINDGPEPGGKPGTAMILRTPWDWKSRNRWPCAT